MGPRKVVENHAILLDLLEELRSVESGLGPKLPDRSQESWDKFFKWVDTEADCNISERVNVCKTIDLAKRTEDVQESSFIIDNDDNEYSLIAKTSIAKDQQVFNIKSNLLLTTETAMNDIDLESFIKNDSIASEMANVKLVLHLLNEYSKREQSHWWSYLSILPKKILPVLMLTKQSTIAYLIASAHIYEALKFLRSIARQYSYFYQRLQDTRLPLRKEFTFEFYAWGVSCVCSRQNELPSGVLSYHSSLALVPVLDMCNHDHLSNQAFFVDKECCLLAAQDLKPNDEITINYGNHTRSSGEFYIHNGFVPQRSDQVDQTLKRQQVAQSNNSKTSVNGNILKPNEKKFKDAIPITIGLSRNNKLYEHKAKLLKILQLTPTHQFRLIANNYENRHGHDPQLILFLCVFSMTEADLEYVHSARDPVGVCDKIYEFAMYHGEILPRGDAQQNSDPNREIEVDERLEEMKQRLAKAVGDYLSMRVRVSIALIDRTIEEATKIAAVSKQNNKVMVDHQAIRLLHSERRILESYVKKDISG